jgi:hypothetical protein
VVVAEVIRRLPVASPVLVLMGEAAHALQQCILIGTCLTNRTALGLDVMPTNQFDGVFKRESSDMGFDPRISSALPYSRSTHLSIPPEFSG